MSILHFVIYVMSATVLAGSLVLAALVAPIGLDNATGIIGGALLGAVLAVPVTIVVSKKIASNLS